MKKLSEEERELVEIVKNYNVEDARRAVEKAAEDLARWTKDHGWKPIDEAERCLIGSSFSLVPCRILCYPKKETKVNNFEKMNYVEKDGRVVKNPIGYIEQLVWISCEWGDPNRSGCYTVQFEDGRIEELYFYNGYPRKGQGNIFQELLCYWSTDHVLVDDEEASPETIADLARCPYFWYSYESENPYYATDLIRVYTVENKHVKFWLKNACKGPVKADPEKVEDGYFKRSAKSAFSDYAYTRVEKPEGE